MQSFPNRGTFRNGANALLAFLQSLAVFYEMVSNGVFGVADVDASVGDAKREE